MPSPQDWPVHHEVMRHIRFELVMAITAVPAAATRAANPNRYSGTPAKKSAAAVIIMMSMAVPRSFPTSTRPITAPASGMAGISTWGQR